MASVAIPMVAGFAAQKLATDVLGVDPKMAAILGMAAGGGAGAWASGGGSFGSLFGSQAGSAAAGQGASTIGQNMFGQTAGMAGMSPKVGGGLNGMDMFASSVNPHAGLASNAFTQNPYVPIEAGGFTGSADAPADLFQTNAPINGYNQMASMPAETYGMDQYKLTDMSQVGSSTRAQELYNRNLNNDLDLMMQGNSYSDMASGQPGMDMFGPSQYDQMASTYPGMDDPSMYMNTSEQLTPLPSRPEIPSQNYDPINQNYQADEDIYTSQLFNSGNTVSGNSVASINTDGINMDAIRAAEMPGGQLDTLGYERATASLNSPTTPPQYNEYDAYARATHGMDSYSMPQSQAVANTQPNPKPNAYNPGPAEAGGNVSDWIKQSGTTRADRVQRDAALRQSEVIKQSFDEMIGGSEGAEKTSWWEKSENQQFLMQAAKILMSDDIEEQQVSSGGGGGGGPPSPGVYSGGSSPAPKVVFGMGPYNGQGQQGYNPREII